LGCFGKSLTVYAFSEETSQNNCTSFLSAKARRVIMRTTNAFVIGFVISISGFFQVVNAQPPTVVDSNLGGGLLITHTNDPTRDFNAARLSYLDLDVVGAAASIRRGAERMREGMADVRDSSRQALQESIVELESLARATEQRSISSVKRLDETFARANYAMAERHYLAALRAREQMARDQFVEDFRRSAEYMQRARQQIGLQIRDEETAMVSRIRTLGLNVRNGFEVTSKEMAHDFRLLEQSLANVRDRLGVRAANIDEPIRR
jgi:hypothetical protein